MLSVKHLIDTNSLTRDDIQQILDTAQSFEAVNNRDIKKVPALRGRTIVNLFLEPSTRTRSSFELAEKRLSADALNMGGSTSSVVKGESLADTIQTIDAMNVDMFICRARLAGTPQKIMSTLMPLSSTLVTASISTPLRPCLTSIPFARTLGILMALKLPLLATFLTVALLVLWCQHSRLWVQRLFSLDLQHST